MALKIKSSTPTILQVIPKLQTGGAEKTAVDISIALKNEGWRPLIASGGGRLLTTLEEQGIEHFQLPLSSKNPWVIWRNIGRLKRLIDEQKVDLVHARSRAPAWSALPAARSRQIPFVTTYHGAYGQTNKLKAFYNSVMARSDLIIGNSQWTADLVRKRHPESADRIIAIARGTDFDSFQQSDISTERRNRLFEAWGVSDDHFIVLHMARLSPLKDQRTVIEAGRQLLDFSDNIRIVFAGDAQGREAYKRELEQQIGRLNLTDKIILAGHCDDPAAALAISDVVLSASKEPETFGRVAVEAGALERPVVVTNLGAVGETVLATPDVEPLQRTGWKIEPEKPDQLVSAVREIYQMPPRHKRDLGQRARSFVTNRFSLDRMCHDTLNAYRGLLDDL